mmetsp:Transcript_21319/g.31636  ORF Transcript_21319/g.31636 Transcript_21319/m.31636 type:complete len:104 (-) Transcript_21319:1227-1538(-)
MIYTQCCYRAEHQTIMIYIVATNRGPATRIVVESNFITTCNAGPAVSLNGSPTVSPVIEALCASEFLPPKLPSSIYFFALSQAPPVVSRNKAMRIPVTVPNMR